MHSFAKPEWLDPRNWSPFIWIWLAVAIVPPIYRYWRKQRVKSWPSVPGKIVLASSNETGMGNSGKYAAEIHYTYSIDGQDYTGVHKQKFEYEELADDFVRDVEDRVIEIRYNPARPSQSSITNEAIQQVQSSRAPAPIITPEPLSPMMRPLAWILGIGALIGFAVSLCVNVAGWLGRAILPQFMFFVMHVGIFVVWFPSVYMMKRLRITDDLKSWKSRLFGEVSWIPGSMSVLSAYTFLNFLPAVGISSTVKHVGSMTDVGEWRTFSGVWMLFYYVAAVSLLAAARLQEKEQA